MIKRHKYEERVRNAISRSPAVALLGPRQCGKTTLARAVSVGWKGCDYFDLDSPQDRRRLQNPELVLSGARGLVVIDEIQKLPELFPVLRSLIDRDTCQARFLILGSASPTLVKGASESLAGRIEFVDLTPFTLEELGHEERRKMWMRGGFPRSFLANSMKDSVAWRVGLIRTFLQRDLLQLGITVPEPAMRRF